MIKYISIIQRINHHLKEFNSYLQPEYAIPLLDLNEINNNSYFLNAREKKWDDFVFPRNCEVGGIYFYIGVSESKNQKIGIYIGKASLTSTIGRRLWSHFRYCWNESRIIKEHPGGQTFRIELISSIPIDNARMTFLSPALEEFLIDRLQTDSCVLLNKQGNYQ